MNATAKYNNAKNSIDLSYQVEDIKGFPGMFEKWFNTNNRKYESIPLPDYIKDLRGGNISVSFSKPKSNQLLFRFQHFPDYCSVKLQIKIY